MLKKLSTKVLTLAAAITLLVPFGISGIAYAQYNGPQSVGTNGCAGTQAVAPGTAADCSTAGTSLSSLITTILNVFSWVVGVVAVIMIIIAGFRYIVSGGEEGGVRGAKNAILFAIVGLVIVAIAQILVQFVIHKTTSVTGG